MKDLPKTSEWLGETNLARVSKKAPQCGDFIQKGNVVICQQCPSNHSIPGAKLDLEGRLVKKER